MRRSARVSGGGGEERASGLPPPGVRTAGAWVPGRRYHVPSRHRTGMIHFQVQHGQENGSVRQKSLISDERERETE